MGLSLDLLIRAGAEVADRFAVLLGVGGVEVPLAVEGVATFATGHFIHHAVETTMEEVAADAAKELVLAELAEEIVDSLFPFEVVVVVVAAIEIVVAFVAVDGVVAARVL